MNYVPLKIKIEFPHRKFPALKKKVIQKMTVEKNPDTEPFEI